MIQSLSPTILLIFFTNMHTVNLQVINWVNRKVIRKERHEDCA